MRKFQLPVPTALPAGFLGLPGEGDRTLLRLEKKLALLALHTLLSFPGERAGTLRTALPRLQAWLTRAARGAERAALVTALANVDVLVPILALKSGLVSAEAALTEGVPALLVAMARASGRDSVAEALLWDAPVTRLFDAARGRVWSFEPPAQGLLVDPSGIELRTHAGELAPLESPPLTAEQPFHAIASSRPVLALADSNPLSMMEEHPEKSGNAVDLGGHPLEEWTERLGQAIELVAATLPTLHAEMSESLQRLVPVGYHAERHLSASYREAPGVVYLTLHPSLLTMAEAIVHETQHGKLNVLRWFDPVLSNGDSTWSKSPVRPDLRPLWGVLLAVHAFVPVAAMHLALAELDHPLSQGEPFAHRRAEVLAANEHGLATLRELAAPTAVGRKVLDGLEELHSLTRAKAPRSASDATVSSLG